MQLFFLVLIPLAFIFSPGPAWSQEVLYRYINKDGVKVIDHAIPPEYVQNGYEVISTTGSIIEVVPPAPSGEEIAAKDEARLVKERFEVLKRRYSSLKEIESAKNRRLSDIDTNITIVKSNISSLKTQIENIMTRAAKAERSGRKVPKALLKELADTEDKLAVAQEQLEIRKKEYVEIEQKFEHEKTTFSEGLELENKKDKN